MRVTLTQTQYKAIKPHFACIYLSTYLFIACVPNLISPACSGRGPCAQYGGWRLDQASELLTDLAEDEARHDQVRRVGRGELYM